MKKLIFILLLCNIVVAIAQTETPSEPIFWDFTPNVQTIKTINAADYIFEGEALDAKSSYYNKDSSKIYTSIKVKVNVIYKGNLTEGEIVELIVEGGTIGLDERVNRHGSSVGYREPYILFCKKLAKLPVSNQGYNLPVKLNYVNSSSYLVYGGEGAAMHGLGEIGFKTKANVDSLLLKIPGVTFLKKKVQTTPSLNLQQSKAPSFEDFMAMQNKRAAIAKANLNALRIPKVKLKAATATSSTVTPTQLILTLTNDSIKTENGYQYYQFDVTASANNSTTYYQNSIIRLNYDTIAFGSNIATTSGALTLSRGIGFAATEYAVHQYNVNRSRINISLNDTAVNATSGNRTPLTTTPIQLFRVKIKISNCAVKPNFIIAEQSFTSGLSWYNLSATANPHDGSNTIFYDSTTYINNLTNSLCPTISDFSPKKIHSGNNELLTITGTGFGTTQGNVLFKNADVRGDTLLKGLDNVYVKPGGWTDTKIEVYVPSKVTENYNPSVTKSGAGSGTFKVVKANGAEAVTSTPLDIEYAFLNVGDGTTDNPFDILHLAKINCINGLVFTLDTSFQAYPDAVATAQKAANDWANVLGITVAIEKNATNQIIYANGASSPNKKVIYFDRNYSGTAETSTVGNKVGSGSSSKYYRTDADIQIAHPAIKNWHFTTNDDLPAFKRDFYQCITHEMGHAIGLNHDVDIATGNGTKEVMYYAVVYYGTVITANQRINLNNYGTRTVAGATAKITKDENTPWSTAGVVTLGTPNPTTPTITASGSATICQGGSVTLTSSNVSGNVWSNGATTQSITVKASGNFSVSNTVGGCTVTSAVKNVTLNAASPPSLSATASQYTICKGNVTLTAVGYAGNAYKWSTGEATITITTAPTATTVYTVTATAENQCESTATVKVNVLAPIMTSTSTANICKGGTVSIPLTANVASSYSWVGSANPNITGISTTAQNTSTLKNTLVNNATSIQQVTYTVTPTSTTGACVGTRQTVTVNVYPTVTMPTASASTICSGGMINISLTANGNIPCSFSWQATDNANTSGESTTLKSSATINDILTNVSASNQQVIYTVIPKTITGGCVGTSQTYTATINPVAIMTSASSTTICSGQILNIPFTSTAIPTQYIYVVNGDDDEDTNPNVSGQGVSQIVSNTLQRKLINKTTIPQTITFFVNTIANKTGCWGPTQTISVTINPPPAIAVTQITEGSNTRITATSNPNYSYSWSTGAVTNSILVPLPTAATNYTLSVTESLHSCAKTFTITISPAALISIKLLDDSIATNLDIQQNISNPFYLYPNPNNGNMILNYGYLTETDNGILTIYDVIGRSTTSYVLDNKATQLQINNDLLNNGTYCYRVTINGMEVKQDKIIIIK